MGHCHAWKCCQDKVHLTPTHMGHCLAALHIYGSLPCWKRITPPPLPRASFQTFSMAQELKWSNSINYSWIVLAKYLVAAWNSRLMDFYVINFMFLQLKINKSTLFWMCVMSNNTRDSRVSSGLHFGRFSCCRSAPELLVNTTTSIHRIQ